MRNRPRDIIATIVQPAGQQPSAKKAAYNQHETQEHWHRTNGHLVYEGDKMVRSASHICAKEAAIQSGMAVAIGQERVIGAVADGRSFVALIKESAMEMQSLQDLFVDQLRDLYNAENQLVKALPKMAKAASSPQLQAAFAGHLDETKQHVERLTQIFAHLSENPKGKKCRAMIGLIEEGQEMIDTDATPEIMDAGLIAAAQRVEHYEMAGYGCVRTYAKLLGNDQAANLLQETLDEEGQANKKLTDIAQNVVNRQAKETQSHMA
jgi:ferritin-like metal-binding protein YciE